MQPSKARIAAYHIKMGIVNGIISIWNRFFRLPYLWVRTSERFRSKGRAVACVNTFFNYRDLEPLKGYVQELMHMDEYLRFRLSEKRIHGQRAWEYGLLFSILDQHPERHSWKVLDVGPGNSTFPLAVRSKVKELTTVDYYSPLEKPSLDHIRRWAKAGVTATSGSVLELQFPDISFDLVTCISTIEHLDLNPETMKPLPQKDYFERTQLAIQEMFRVLKPGGYLYLTTEAFLPDLQKTDKWGWSLYEGIGAAYPIPEIENLFIRKIQELGGKIGEYNYNQDLLIKDEQRSNWRGRYITTFSLFAQKM